MKLVTKDERLNDFLARYRVKWQFNLSRAPWSGGQFAVQVRWKQLLNLVRARKRRARRGGGSEQQATQLHRRRCLTSCPHA